MRNFSLKIILVLALLVIQTIGGIQVTGQANTFVTTIDNLVANGHAIEISGEGRNDGAGAIMSAIGDINQDGYDDFITGAQNVGDQVGRAYIILGRSNWESFSFSESDYIINGDVNRSAFGSWFTDLGDIDGDNFLDFGVSASNIDDVGRDSGKVFILSSSNINSWGNSPNVSEVALASYIGENPGDSAGLGFSGIGDTNNDGYDDFLISSKLNNQASTNAGKVYLIYGRPNNMWQLNQNLNISDSSFIPDETNTLVHEAFLGIDTAGVGDINNDGYTDFAITSFPLINFQRIRQISIFFGKATSWGHNIAISDANVTVTLGNQYLAFSGKHLSGQVDVNNDGYDDIIIGSYLERSTSPGIGKTFILLGRATNNWQSQMKAEDLDASLIGISELVDTGYGVSGLRDINNDGYDEILTTEFTPGNDNKETIAHVFLGRPTDEWGQDMSLSESHITITSGLDLDDNIPNGAFANGIEDVGDVNGDGIPDFTINKWQGNDGAGSIFLVLNTNEIDLSNTEESEAPLLMNYMGFIIITIVLFKKNQKEIIT